MMTIRSLSMHSAAALCGLLLFSTTSIADLQWREKAISHTARLNETAFVAEFHFTNGGDTPVTVKGARASCGCTVVDFKPRVYQPGEEGVIRATFTYGSRVGEQNKTITVSTDDPGELSIGLKLTVEIPELVHLSSKLVMWQGEDRQAQQVTIEIKADEPMEITKVTSSEKSVNATLVTIERGRKYQLTLKPDDDAPSGTRSQITVVAREMLKPGEKAEAETEASKAARSAVVQRFWAYVVPKRLGRRATGTSKSNTKSYRSLRSPNTETKTEPKTEPATEEKVKKDRH